MKNEIINKYNLNKETIDNYFSLSVEEQVEFINTAFKLNISQEEIKTLLNCSWSKITQDIREFYKKSTPKNAYLLKKDINQVKKKEDKFMEELKQLKQEITQLKQEITEIKNTSTENNNICNNILLLDVDTTLCNTTKLCQFKIDSKVEEAFTKFAQQYPILNKQVLVSMALQQFMSKYKKD